MIKTIAPSEGGSISPATRGPLLTSAALVGVDLSGISSPVVGSALNYMQPSVPSPLSSSIVGFPLISSSPSMALEIRGHSQISQSGGHVVDFKSTPNGHVSVNEMKKQEVFSFEIGDLGIARADELCTPTCGSVLDAKNLDTVQIKQSVGSSTAQVGGHDVSLSLGQIPNAASADVASASSKNGGPPGSEGGVPLPLTCSSTAVHCQDTENAPSSVSALTCPPGSVQVTRQTHRNQGRADPDGGAGSQLLLQLRFQMSHQVNKVLMVSS
ncbi:hypothetical protein NL676_009303 [Syzygium grande]|nr:hypothetical protein NL676_009303 [Syzygium grande]